MNWIDWVGDEMYRPLGRKIEEFLVPRAKMVRVHPDPKDVFTPFKYADRYPPKVVILGQDPYHEPGQANGLAFSVRRGVYPPIILQNIFIELKNDVGIGVPRGHGTLTAWAKQGVMLLNSSLTVEEGKPMSHAKLWKPFTIKVIQRLTESRLKPVFFILWGQQAYDLYMEALDESAPLHFTHSAHPSIPQNGFYGSKPFSAANEWLEYYGKKTIDWSVR